MRIVLACPAPRGSSLGNRITAERWRRIFALLGHRAVIVEELQHERCDVLVALHALRSAEAVRRSRADRPERPVIVALTGTDLYRDLAESEEARGSIALADRVVVLHDRALLDVPRAARDKTIVIRQSADAGPRVARSTRTFDVAFVAHLRPEKDPLRAPLAARLLPAGSRVRIVHAGRALTEAARVDAEREAATNPRYVWLGELSPARTRRLIARSRALVLTSSIEGGANVLGEAIVSTTPPIASRIPASISALGADYPALFRVGDTEALARLLERVERDPRFYADVLRRVRARRPLFAPSKERAAWRTLLAALP